MSAIVRAIATANVVASFTGQIHGAIASAPCGVSAMSKTPAVLSFKETTPAGARPAFGSFELRLATTCAASFYQALFSHESIDGLFTFRDVAGRVSRRIELANARLIHVDVGVGSENSNGAPAVDVGIASTEVDRNAPDLSGAESRVLQSGGVGGGATESWNAGGLGVSAHFASIKPPMDAAIDLAAWHLSVRAPVDAHGMPGSRLKMQLDPVVAEDNFRLRPVHDAAIAHAALSVATVAFVNSAGTAGITVRLKAARLIADTVLAGAAGKPRRHSLSLTAGELTVTDIVSGRTASMP